MASALAMPRRMFRNYALVSGAVLIGIAMTLIVFANYSDWPGVLICSALLAAGLYGFGTLGYRLSERKGGGRVQLNTMLGSHQVDLRKGYRLKGGRLVHVLRVGRKRYRVSGALGDADAVDAWLASAARQDDVG